MSLRRRNKAERKASLSAMYPEVKGKVDRALNSLRAAIDPDLPELHVSRQVILGCSVALARENFQELAEQVDILSVVMSQYWFSPGFQPDTYLADLDAGAAWLLSHNYLRRA